LDSPSPSSKSVSQALTSLPCGTQLLGPSSPRPLSLSVLQKYAKYDSRNSDIYDEAKARTVQLWQKNNAAKRVKLQRDAKLQLLKAHRACKGEAGCESILTQVMGMFGK